MSVRWDVDVLKLDGDLRVEDAETVLQAFQSGSGRKADLGGCASMHAAVAQVLLAFGAELTGEPADPFLRDWLVPALSAAAARVGAI